jgi:hypothetical protein
MRLLSALVIAVLWAPFGAAQTAPAEPQFANVFFGLDAGKLVPLERETTFIQAKAHGFIVMSVKANSEIPGAKSPVRFRSGQPLDFVVMSPGASSAIDPSTIYVLRKLTVKKKSRELLLTHVHATPFGATAKTELSEGVLPVTFAHYGSSSLKMNTAPLPPGEYAVSQAYGQTVFCFGID